MASHTKLIGDIGVAAVQLELLKHGLKVLIPFDDNSKYDLITIINDTFYKIQVKTTEKIKYGEVMEFATSITDPYNKTNKSYSKEDVDFFCLYCLENDWIGMINFDEYNGRRVIPIRVLPPKNGNSYRTMFADVHDMHQKLLKWFKIDYLRADIIHNEKKQNNSHKKQKRDNTKKNTQTIKQRPGKEELEQLIYNTPFVQIAKMYGVTDNAVKKWCKKYGLPFRKKDMV